MVHCAASIVVPESVEQPLAYYRNNEGKTLVLLDAMARHEVNRMLFSSSASIYGPEENFEVDEQSALLPSSPYARTKSMTETILADVPASTDLRVIS